MTLKQIAQKLISEGRDVRYRVRKDGSIRITSIDGLKFKASQGNEYARRLTGERLSLRRQWQLQSKALATPKGQWGHKKTEKLVDDVLLKKLRRVQRLYRKKGIEEGTPTMRNVNFTLRTYGYKEALERLTQSERYAKGIAYPINIQYFIERLERERANATAGDSHLIYKIIEYLRNHINNESIYEFQLQKLLERYYECFDKHILTVDEWYRQSHDILVNQQYRAVSKREKKAKQKDRALRKIMDKEALQEP